MTPAPDGRPVLITGGAGFIGCNIADRLASAGHPVTILDALVRGGVEANLEWLERRHGDRVRRIVGDVRDADAVGAAAREARAVFHMAAQVAVTTSFTAPRDDFDVNVVGTLNVLDALRRRSERVPLIFASTNKVYGDLRDLDFALVDEAYRPVDQGIAELGIGEDRPLDFHTPYGCSKGAADQYVLDYSRSFDVPTAVLRMSCIYGERQMGTEDQGWVAHFLIRALEGQPITIYGDGFQVRDVLDVSDAVDAYVAAWANIDRVAGRAFNLGGGPRNAISLRALLAFAGELLHRNVEIEFDGWRAGDQKYFVADTRAVQAELGVGPSVPWRRGVARLARWLAESRRMDGVVARIDANAAGAAA